MIFLKGLVSNAMLCANEHHLKLKVLFPLQGHTCYVVVPCLDGGASPKNREQCTVNSVTAYLNTQSPQQESFRSFNIC